MAKNNEPGLTVAYPWPGMEVPAKWGYEITRCDPLARGMGGQITFGVAGFADNRANLEISLALAALIGMAVMWPWHMENDVYEFTEPNDTAVVQEIISEIRQMVDWRRITQRVPRCPNHGWGQLNQNYAGPLCSGSSARKAELNPQLHHAHKQHPHYALCHQDSKKGMKAAAAKSQKGKQASVRLT